MAAYYRPPAPPHHDHPYPYHPPPPPPAAYPHSYPSDYSPPPPSLYPSQDEVHTLFVTGLPEDVKALEVCNLFLDFPGFRSSQLNSASQLLPQHSELLAAAHESLSSDMQCRGFSKLKMWNTHGVSVAFVDFKDVACSNEALNHLQGTMLYSSDGEGMQLEYAKSQIGLQKSEKT